VKVARRNLEHRQQAIHVHDHLSVVRLGNQAVSGGVEYRPLMR
jgi:hypothetical protein